MSSSTSSSPSPSPSPEPLTTSTSSASKLNSRASPYQYVTDAAMMRVGHDHSLVAGRVVPLQEYFSNDYMKRKGRNYLQACEEEEGALSREFAEGDWVRHYSAFLVKAYPFSDYDKPEYHDKRAFTASIRRGRKESMFRRQKLLSAIDTYIP
jgi:hypothetical protein